MERLIDEAECLAVTSLSRVTRWRMENQGKFPKRRKISQNRIAWIASEISDWVNEVAAQNSRMPTPIGGAKNDEK